MIGKRLIKELQDLQSSPVPGTSVVADGPLKWIITFEGPAGSPYEGGQFKMSATFPENYPFAMAKFKFETPVYHPNVYKDGDHAGEICDKALGSDDWKPNSMTRNVI